MNQPRTIGFYGYSGSGKTTLIESLIGDLAAKGYQIAVIKQSDQTIRMDTPGKDTDRFREAGARAVALASAHETDLIFDARLEIPAVIEAIASARPIDLVIVESANDAQIAKVRLGSIEERPNTVWNYDGDYRELMEMIIQFMEA